MKLYYVILGATPPGRNTEQHDVFFGLAENLKDLVPHMKNFWPEAKGQIHIDCYQEVQFADGYEIKVVDRKNSVPGPELFFVNLGGYKPGCFEEFHEQFLMVGSSMAEIVKRVKKTDFYKNMGFKNAASHIDDKHGVDIDDIFQINDILPPQMKENYTLILGKTTGENRENFTHIGYLKIDKIK